MISGTLRKIRFASIAFSANFFAITWEKLKKKRTSLWSINHQFITYGSSSYKLSVIFYISNGRIWIQYQYITRRIGRCSFSRKTSRKWIHTNLAKFPQRLHWMPTPKQSQQSIKNSIPIQTRRMHIHNTSASS